MPLLPRTDPSFDLRILVERQTVALRGLPRMQTSGHSRIVDVASVAQAADRMSAPQRTEPAPTRAPAAPAQMSSDGSTAGSTSEPRHPVARRRPTRIASLHVGLIAAAVALVLLVVFLVENAHTVDISFLGGHLRVSLAVAMLIAAVAGALIVGAAGTARIEQLRRKARRDLRSDDHR